MRILQISTAVPKQMHTTDEMLENFPSKLPDGVRQNIFNLGVSKRYMINHGTVQPMSETLMNEAPLVDLCLEACQKALTKAELSVGDIDQVIVAYDASPFLSPGLGQLLIRKLGFNPYVKHVNIHGEASTAFPKALEIAENCLSAHPRSRILLCISGANSYWFFNQVQGMKDIMEIRQINAIKNKSRRQAELRKWIATMQFFLFGDGVASAIVADQGEGLSVERIVEVTNIGKKDYLAGCARLSAFHEPVKFGFHSHLDRNIPSLGMKYSSIALRKLLGRRKNILENVRKWVVHTGSEKILSLMAEHHRIKPEKLRESYHVLREYGNLSGASLPFILEKIVASNKLSRNDMILMLGYGWGFSASASLLKYG